VTRSSAVTSPPPLKKPALRRCSPGTYLPYNTVVAAGGAAGVNGGTAGGAAVISYSTAGGAVEVNYGAAGRQQGVSLAAGKAVTVKSEPATSTAAVCPGGSTVPVTVTIVVKHKLIYQSVSCGS
jgi:hypothetical protein